MKNYISGQFKHFGLFLFYNLKYYSVFYLFIVAGIILFATGLLFLLIMAQPQMFINFLNQSFWNFMNLGGIILTTSAFSIYGNKNARMHLLTLPVSVPARFTSLILFSIPLFLVVIVSVFTLMANVIAHIFSSLELTKSFSFNPFLVDGAENTQAVWGHLWFYFVFQSILLMVGSFFPKLGFIKSALAFLVILILYVLLNYLTSLYTEDRHFFANLFRVLVNSDFQALRLRELMPLTYMIWQIVWALLLPFSWYIIYLRIKELEA